MIFRPFFFTAIISLLLSTLVQAGSTAYPVFQVSLSSDDDPGRKIAVELYSLGPDGLFVRIDGKTVGKVAVIETDPKFVFKRYLADWDQLSKQFRITLQHETRRKADGIGLEAPRWEMFVNGKRFTAERPEVKTILKANLNKHKLFVKTTFAEKPGGMTLRDLSNLFYPLPIEPHNSPEQSVEYFEDPVSGVRRTSAKYSVVSRIPTEHILAYIRGTSLTVRVSVESDSAVLSGE